MIGDVIAAVLLRIAAGIARVFPITYQAAELSEAPPERRHSIGEPFQAEGFSADPLYTCCDSLDYVRAADSLNFWAQIPQLDQAFPAFKVYKPKALAELSPLIDRLVIALAWIGAGPPGARSPDDFNGSFNVPPPTHCDNDGWIACGSGPGPPLQC